MVQFARGWALDVDYGDDWMFVTLRSSGGEEDFEPPLAETVWELAEEAHRKHVAFEVADGTILRSWIIGQLILLGKRFEMEQGLFRLNGMSEDNYRIIELMGLSDRLYNYRNREAAVMGRR